MSKQRRQVLIAWIVAAVLLGVTLLWFLLSKPVLVDFIDVGQGDACLIQAGIGGNVLIDGGDEGSGQILAQYLAVQNVRVLDAAVISHFHTDHCLGIIELLKDGFPIRALYLPRFLSETEEEKELLELAAKAEIPLRRLMPEEKLKIGKATYHVLWPEAKGEYFKLNNQSLLLRMDYGKNRVLFTGDNEISSQCEMVADQPEELRANVLKVPHHGGKSAVYHSFLWAVKPEIAVIGVGTDNYHGHPSKEMLDALLELGTATYRTDRDGVVRLVMGPYCVKRIETRDKWRKLQ